MPQKVIVNNNCIGCWACIVVCPEIFAFSDKWQAYVKEGVNIEDITLIDDTKNVCPVAAIQYE
jgi:ferredoxin